MIGERVGVDVRVNSIGGHVQVGHYDVTATLWFQTLSRRLEISE